MMRMAEQIQEGLQTARFASVDVTARCPFRCRHCYYYRSSSVEPDLDDNTFLQRLQDWRDQSGVDCMLWVGGEPLLRPNLLAEGMKLFRRNALFTGGGVSIPSDLPCGIAVSLDGTSECNDFIRGEGSFKKIMNMTGGGKGYLFHCTISALNLDDILPLTKTLRERGASGVLYGLYTPSVGDSSEFVLNEFQYHQAVDNIQLAKQRYGAFVLNTPRSIELMQPQHRSILESRCLYKRGLAVALDHHVRPKSPCSYGTGVDCARCGCSALFMRVAAEEGDAASTQVLSNFFQC